MKRLIPYTVFGIIIAVIFTLIGAGWGRRPVAAVFQELVRLQNGWNEAQAQLGSQQDINERLDAEAQGLRRENKRKANQVARLEAQIQELTGSGPADVDAPRTLAKFEDQNVSIRYHIVSEDFDYTMKPRKITLSIVENDKKVSAKAWDILADREIQIDRMEFLRLPLDYKPWYKKINVGLAAGYCDGLLGGVSGGYGKTRVIVFGRLADELVPGVMLHRDLW